MLLLLGQVATGTAQAADPLWWSRVQEGWFWYREPPTEERPTPEGKHSPLADFEAMQKELDRLKRTAVMEPSEHNLLAYMRYQRLVMDKSERFAERWQKLVWRDPSLDYSTTGRPTNALAISVFDERQHQQRKQAIQQLARDHALLFVFRGDCPHCHRFAPVLKRFAERHGLTVFPVTLDGRALPEYPDAHADNGMAKTLSPEVVPAVYVSNPKTRQIEPIGFGALSESDLEERLASAATIPPESPR
jgi:conjugal transfer pilus assembly protein TraF